MYSNEFCEIFKNTHFGEDLRMTASTFQILYIYIAKQQQQEEEIQCESESFKSKLTLY